MRRDAIGPGELAEETLQSVKVALDIGIDLGISALEIRVGDDARRAVAWTDNQHHVDVLVTNDAVEMEVNEIEPRSGAEVAEESRLDVIAGEGPPEERIVLEVNLTDG